MAHADPSRLKAAVSKTLPCIFFSYVLLDLSLCAVAADVLPPRPARDPHIPALRGHATRDGARLPVGFITIVLRAHESSRQCSIIVFRVRLLRVPHSHVCMCVLPCKTIARCMVSLFRLRLPFLAVAIFGTKKTNGTGRPTPTRRTRSPPNP